jgi:heme/copper-type cytochrome/quinol oxidase subunit 2
MPSRLSGRRTVPSLAVLLTAVIGLGVASLAQEQGRYEITLTAKRYEFSQTRIEVAANDVVRITLVAEDIPHTFTVDEYRISKRAAPGRPVTFEFRADKPGTFPFYCNLTAEEGCRGMRGELVVTPRRP